MKKTILLLSISLAFFAPLPAMAASIFKSEPATPEGKEVMKAFEQFVALRLAGDARGASEFYTEDAAIKYHFGFQNEVKMAEGRNAIYILFSGASRQTAEYTDYEVVKAEGDQAEVIGRLRASFIGPNAWTLVRDSKVLSKLRKSGGQWRIYYSEVLESTLTRL